MASDVNASRRSEAPRHGSKAYTTPNCDTLAHAVSAHARVSRPDEGADRLRPARALAAASIGLAAGLCTVWLARDDLDATPGGAPTATASHALPPEIDALAPETDAGSSHAGAVVGDSAATTVRAVADAGMAQRSEGPAADAGADRAVRRTAASRAVVLGTVAYLRCDGVELHGGRFPCPRDRALEAAGWQILEGLSGCTNGDPGAGTLEARIELAGHDTVDARFSQVEPAGAGAGLELRAVDRCVGAALRALHSELAPSRMIVSFRVELR